MLRSLIIILFSLVVFENVEAKVGKGELKLSERTMIHFIEYLYGSNDKYSQGKGKKNNPYLMTISRDGRSSYYFFCSFTITQCKDSAARDATAIGQAIARCEKISGGSPCSIFATVRRINWKNGSSSRQRYIPRKLLKDPYALAQRVQELGFYDGDITQLPAFDYETGLVDRSRKITGEEKSTSTTTNTNKKKPKITKKESPEKKDTGDVVTKLKELNELYKTGALSKEEFVKAKKKLLN